MKSFLLSVFLILTLCVSLPSEAAPSKAVTDATFVEYMGNCLDEGYVAAAATPEGRFYVDFIQAVKKSKLYYDRLTSEDKQLFADVMWELESKYTREQGCKIILDALTKGSDEVASQLLYVGKI